MEGSASFLSGIKSYFWGPEIKPLELFPRKAANLFDDDRKVKPLLPSTYAEFVGGFSPNVKRLEYSFYPDLATKRTVTAVVTAIKDGKPVPAPDKEVFWRIGSGSAPKATIQKNVSTSDGNGCAELLLEHPVETPPIGQRTIKIQASFHESFQDFSEIILRVRRNEDVLADLNPLLTGRSLLVYQKEKPEASEGVKRLQHLLNQVVARKKSCSDFEWIKFDGKYDATVKKVVAAFISKFGGGFDYKKGQFDVKVNEQLKEYIKQEYGKYEDGCLVDRSLLIGDKLWDDSQPISKIDGLLDIYNGVVERFFAQMVARAEEYTACNTFWLHRPVHRPYKQGQIEQVQMKKTVDLRTKAGDDQAVIKDKTGNAEQAKKGQTLKFLADSSVKITHWHYVEAIAKVTGWVSEDDVSEDGTTKVKFKNTATIYDGTTSQKKARTDSNGNTIKVAAGTTVKRTAKKKVSGKWWYQVLLLQKAGWTSSEESKLSTDKKKVEITKSTTIREKSTDSSAAIKDWEGNEMKPSSGNKFTYLKKSTPATEGWYQIESKSGVAGWVPAKDCLPFANDRVIPENAGTFGMPGVAYSYGSKDRPAEFTSFLNGNPKQPSTIKCWNEYEDTHRPGKTSKDNDTANWTGIDCSGFTQNCVTYSFLSDSTRVVPDSRMKRIGRVAGATGTTWPWTGCIPAKSFVGDWARQIPYDADDVTKQWLYLTDIITSPGHIVWVGERHPVTLGNARDFQVCNAYGGDSRSNESPSVPKDKFIRKLIKMPFKWWGIRCGDNGIKLGRIYFWG